MSNDRHSERDASAHVDARPPERRLSYDLLRVLCIAGVVAIHTFGAMAADPAVWGTPTWLPAAMLSSGFVWVVPVFVMLSGALTLAPRAHRGGAGAFIRRRALRIVPALVIWTFLYLVGIRMLLLGEQLGPWEIVTLLADGTVYPHLYFLYLIAGLSLFAPVVAPFLHNGGTVRALTLGMILTALTVLVFIVPGLLAVHGVDRSIPLGTLTYWLPYVGFFVLGYALSISRIPRAWIVGLALLGLAAGALVLFQVSGVETGRLLDAVARTDYQGSAVAVLSVAAFVVGTRALDRVQLGARSRRAIRSLSDAAFGVYLVHLIVLLLPYELLPGFRDHNSLGQTALAYVVILVISFPLVMLARRIPVVRSVF